MKEALFYETISEGGIECGLCPYHCPISPSRHGQCGVRLNKNGKLFTLTYGRISTELILPIEELSLYHFHPGSRVLVVGTQGCTMRCPFCNTWRVSQAGTRTRFVSPEELLEIAREKEVHGVAFGVNEPIIALEYILDVIPIFHKAGLFVILATNGFISSTPLFDILPKIDAFLVDIKGFEDSFYEQVCGGFRKEIYNNIVSINVKSHLEVSALIIGGKNDNEVKIQETLHWLANLPPDPPPLHLLQYKPAFQFTDPETDPMRMYYLQEIARRILPHVYLSNMAVTEANITYCPSCRESLIVREGGIVKMGRLNGNKCTICGSQIKLIP